MKYPPIILALCWHSTPVHSDGNAGLKLCAVFCNTILNTTSIMEEAVHNEGVALTQSDSKTEHPSLICVLTNSLILHTFLSPSSYELLY